VSDDKTNRGAQDRARVSGDETYEIDYFAGKHGLSREQAEQLIQQHGNSREVLDREAEKMKTSV
jgi:hypothetical protein